MGRLKNNMMKCQIPNPPAKRIQTQAGSRLRIKCAWRDKSHLVPNTPQENALGARQINPKSQFPKLQTLKFRTLIIGSLVIIWNLVFGAWNLTYLYAEDKIMAIVNNEVITQKDLNDFLNFTRMQLNREYGEEEVETRIRTMKKDLQEKLIDDHLILQEAKSNNIKIDENRIKARIAEIKRRYPSDAEFQNELAGQGLVQADLERRIREQMLMYIIVEQNVQNKIMVRPEEVTDFYNKNTKEFVSPEERDLDVIILDTDKEDLAREFSNKFKSGIKLDDLATKYPFTQDNLKSKRQGELRQDIEDIVFKLGVQEISDPIKVNDKYYVFKLNNIIPAKQLTLSEVQDRIHAFLFEKKMQEQLVKWLDELRAKAYIKVMP